MKKNNIYEGNKKKRERTRTRRTRRTRRRKRNEKGNRVVWLLRPHATEPRGVDFGETTWESTCQVDSDGGRGGRKGELLFGSC